MIKGQHHTISRVPSHENRLSSCLVTFKSRLSVNARPYPEQLSSGGKYPNFIGQCIGNIFHYLKAGCIDTIIIRNEDPAYLPLAVGFIIEVFLIWFARPYRGVILVEENTTIFTLAIFQNSNHSPANR